MSSLTPEALRQFQGDLTRYRHAFNRAVIYTPGVRYVAQEGKAYWLIDAIASYYGSPVMKEVIAKDERLQWLQFWRLKVREDFRAALTMRADSGEEPAIRQEIPYTDFPLSKVDIWSGYDGTHWTLYLPSEH